MSMANVARGELLRRQDRLPEADQALARGVELARGGNAKFELAYGLLTHAEVKSRLGDVPPCPTCWRRPAWWPMRAPTRA